MHPSKYQGHFQILKSKQKLSGQCKVKHTWMPVGHISQSNWLFLFLLLEPTNFIGNLYTWEPTNLIGWFHSRHYNQSIWFIGHTVSMGSSGGNVSRKSWYHNLFPWEGTHRGTDIPSSSMSSKELQLCNPQYPWASRVTKSYFIIYFQITF